jgi:hypothetical protein
MTHQELTQLANDLEKTGADVRLVRIVLANTTDADDIAGVLASFADDFQRETLPLGNSPAVRTLKVVALNVGRNASRLETDTFDFGAVGCGLDNREAREERRVERTVDDFFRPRRPVPERDHDVDQFFGYRERAKA